MELFEDSLSLLSTHPVRIHIVTNTRTNLVTETESDLSQMIDVGVWMVEKKHKKETNRAASLIFYFCQSCLLSL